MRVFRVIHSGHFCIGNIFLVQESVKKIDKCYFVTFEIISEVP